MKFIFFFFCLAIFANEFVHSFDKATVLRFAPECKEEAGASDKDLEVINEMTAPISEEGQCMVACILRKMGLMTKEGEYSVEGNNRDIDLDYGGNRLKANNVKILRNNCKLNSDETPVGEGCGKASQIFTCIQYHNRMVSKQPLPTTSRK